MGKRQRQRNLKNQFQYVISQSGRLGHKKHAEAKNGVDTTLYIYAGDSMDKMRDFAGSFARFLMENFPEIKMVKNIKKKHVLAYIKARGKQWSKATCTEYQHRFTKLGKMVNQVYHVNVDFNVEIKPWKKSESDRDKMMTDKHISLLRKTLESGNSCAKFVPLVALAIGARSEEIRFIRPEDIDLKRGVVHLTNCKNGRNRTVPIRKEFLPEIKEMKEFLVLNHWKTVTNGQLKSGAVDKAVRRAMEKCGISGFYRQTSVHAIRKNFATHRYLEERKKGLSQKEAFTVVSRELGHNTYRVSLFKKYVHLNDL